LNQSDVLTDAAIQTVFVIKHAAWTLDDEPKTQAFEWVESDCKRSSRERNFFSTEAFK
jgi:hypothetical protein